MESPNQVPQFDIGEIEQPTVEQYNIDTVNKPSVDPEVLRERAEKYSFGTGIPSTEIAKQLETDGDRALRESVAASESLKIRQAQNRLLVDYARRLDRPLTLEELNEVEEFTNHNFGISPDTVLEEAYGKAFSNLAITNSRTKQLDASVMSQMPDATLDGLDAVGRQVARRELANGLIQDLALRHQQTAEDLTPGNFFSDLGTRVIDAFDLFTWNQDKRYEKKTPSLDLVTDYGQVFLPGYATVKLGGWNLDMGESLEEQYREFLLLPPSEFKQKFSATVEALAEDNLPLAIQYAQGFLRYSSSDRVLDTVFGYADWLSLGATAVVGTNRIARAGKAKPTDVPPAQGIQPPGAQPSPPAAAPEVPEIKTVQEAVDEIKDFVHKLKDTSRAANARSPEEASTILGDLDAAAELQVHKELTEGIRELDPFGDTVQLRDKIPSLFIPTAIADDMGSLSLGRINKHRAHATAHANQMLRIIKNNNNVTRLNDQQIAEAIRLGREDLARDYSHISDAFLDVSNGGPFRTYTPDEQLINLYTNELRLGQIPEPPRPPSKTAINRDPNAVDSLLEYLRVEKTTHQNSAQTRNNIVKGYNDLIGEYHKSIEAGNKKSFLDFVNQRKGLGGLFDSMVEAIVTRTGKPLTPAQLKRLQQEIGLGPTPTGDVFVDRLNALTARRGRILVRDLYDQMKREKKFEGGLGEFRKKIDELRKTKKIKMSPYRSETLRPTDLPKPAPPRKPKSVKVTPKPVKVTMKQENQSIGQLIKEETGTKSLGNVRVDKLEQITRKLVGTNSDLSRMDRLVEDVSIFDSQVAEQIDKFMRNDFELPNIKFTTEGLHKERKFHGVYDPEAKLVKVGKRENILEYAQDGETLLGYTTKTESRLHSLWHEIAHHVVRPRNLASSTTEKIIDALAIAKMSGANRWPKFKNLDRLKRKFDVEKQEISKQGALPLSDKQRPPRETVRAVRDDFAQRLYDTIASLRVGNPIAGTMKFRLPGTKRDITVKNFPDLAGRATAKFRRDTEQALEADMLNAKNFQGMIDEWSEFVKLTRSRVPIRKGSRTLGAFDIKAEIGKRSQSQKARFDVDESSLEEGNFSEKEFARDVGYGNETFRNRIIDSGLVTSTASKTGGTKRVHYVEPPQGFGKPKGEKKKAIPSRAQKYPQAEPKTDADLMMALTELLTKLAKTNNNNLYDRVAKYLSIVERRNYATTRKGLGEDLRTVDPESFGSPYGTLPLPADTVERRVLRKVIPKGYRKITAEEFAAKRAAGQPRKQAPKEPDIPKAENDKGFMGLSGTTDSVTTRKGVTDPAFVGRDYSKKPEPPPSQKALNKKDRAIYDALEREAYVHLNNLVDSGKVSKIIKVGKPSAVLFKKREEAAYWGTEVYGLNPNQYRIKQQGSGYYIAIPRIVDETKSSIRDLRVTPGNQVSTSWATALLGWGIAPDNYVDDLSKFNRAVVTYLPQEMHRLVQDAAKEILKMPKAQRDQVNEMLIAHRDHVYVDADAKVRRGRYNNTIGEFEREFLDRHKTLPTDEQIAAYFDYVRYMDLDLALRDFHLVRDMGRLGYEKTSLGFYKPTVDGKSPERGMSKPFATKQIDELPYDTSNVENWGVFVYNPHTKQGQFTLRGDLTPEHKEYMDDLIKNHGYKILQIGNPLEKPVKGIARTDEIVNFLVVKDFTRVKYDFSNIPRRPGGHVRYQDEIFAKQPRMRNTKSGWIYEGDETFMNFTTEAAAKKYVPRIERARKLLKAGREQELERYLSKNLPFSVEEFKSFFLAKMGDDGVEIPPRFSLDHEFTYTTAGKNTFDMAHFKNRMAHYKGFTNAIRSDYNDFAAWVDKKFLGQRDPDVPAMQEFNTSGGKPVFELGAPRLIDPWEMINSSLSNIVRSRYLNDLKIQAAETFVEQFAKVMKTPIEELRRNPIFYLHNPVWDKSTDDFATLMSGIHYQQASLHLIGTESVLGKSMNYIYTKMADGLYKHRGQKATDTFTETFRNAKNPVDLARAGVFHAKLGMFNPVQFLVQSSAMVHAASMKGWDKMLPAAGKMVAARWLGLTEDPKMIRGMADFLQQRMSKIGGFDADEFVDGYNELKKTGFYNVGGEYANRDDFFDPKVFGSKTGKYLDKSAFFFTEGERAQRITAWFVAYNEWRAANPGKVMTNSERSKVLEQAHFLTNRMARNSNANIQNGTFAVSFQFLSYQWRMAESILGNSMTRAQKARVLLTYSALYGLPVGASTAIIYPFYDDIRQGALERGVDMTNTAVKALHDGILSTLTYLMTGESYNFGERFGPAGLSIVKELFDDDKGFLELLGGAVGSVVGDIIGASDGVYNAVMQILDPNHAPPTMADFVEVFRNISTFNNAYRAYYMLNTKQYFTKNDVLVTEDNTGMDAFMSFFAGVVPTDVDDTFLMLNSLKEQKEAQQAARIEATKYLRRMMHARNDGDWDKVDANLRLAKAILLAGGVRESDYGSVLKQAYEGHESLFERALQQFVEQAPLDQMEARKERAMETMDRKRMR